MNHKVAGQLSEFAQHLYAKLREAERREKAEMAYEKEMDDRMIDVGGDIVWSEEDEAYFRARQLS